MSQKTIVSKTRGRKSNFSTPTAMTPKWIKMFLWATSVFLFLVIGGTIVFLVSYYRGSSSNVVVEIEGPNEVYRGVPFEIEVAISNQTDNLINQVELALNFTNGIVNLSGFELKDTVSVLIGDMGGGSLTKKTYKFLAIGDVDASEEIVFNLSYFSGGKARFEVGQTQKIDIRGSAIKLEVKKPDQILPGSTFELDIDYKNVSDFDFSQVVLEARYPSSFKFISSSLRPDSLNNYWQLGELLGGSSGNFKIKGTLFGVEGDRFILPILFSAKFIDRDYQVAEQLVELAISSSPLTARVLVNRRTDYVARIGDRLTYSVQYENSSGIALADVVIKVDLVGELYDFASLTADAHIDLVTHTVMWDSSRIPALRLLDPGASGEVSLEIGLKNQFPIKRLNDKNFYLRFNAEVTSPSVPYYLKAPKTRAVASIETKVAGLVSVDTKGFYRDAQASILNLGLMPPKVNLPTQYSVHWVLRNYSTDVKDVSIRATLEPGVTWVGIVKSNIDSVPLYNEGTRKVTWTIDEVRATKGILDEPIEAVFQIEATPTIVHVGQFQPLISETSLSAVDEFTGLGLFSSDVALNSSLPDDVTIGQNGGRVVP